MKKLTAILFSIIFLQAGAQDSSKKTYQLSGYIKDLQSVAFANRYNNTTYTNLIHNRINFKWEPSENITTAIEVRNRFYWGSDMKNNLQGQSSQNENEWVNLSANWYENNNLGLYSDIERFWIEYRKSKLNLRVGRQRVNWGVANIWNPNDIFNSYNFLDFDYEERPGCDAAKFQYLINDVSNVEMAVSFGDKITAAAKYFVNKGGYDLQLISGIYQNKFTAGMGWAGGIGDIGYKGEAQFFLNGKDSQNCFNTTMELDYVFKNNWYVNTAILYNQAGLNSPISNWSQLSLKISPTNLMPARWNILVGSSKEFTPLFNGNISIIYSPGVNMLILFPSVKYNVMTNLDLDLVWQSFFSEIENKFQGVVHAGYVRIKWSF